MARAKAGNQWELGSYVYFFESPAPGMTDCLITAHGGHVAGRQFNLPPGVKVFYSTDYNKTINFDQGPIRTPLSGAPRQTDPAWTFTGPGKVADQLLGKSLGTHWLAAHQRDGAQYYLFIEAKMRLLLNFPGTGPNWVPHFVSIRNRKFAGSASYVWLSNVIELVKQNFPTVVNFYPAACRGVVGNEYADRATAQSYR
jgi:hypothetical protein